MIKLQPKAYIFLITSFGSEGVHRKLIERGAIAYSEKPIRLDRLRVLTDEVISFKRKDEEEAINEERRILLCVKQKSSNC
jgi:DNA-binding NtrC family response regulator